MNVNLRRYFNTSPKRKRVNSRDRWSSCRQWKASKALRRKSQFLMGQTVFHIHSLSLRACILNTDQHSRRIGEGHRLHLRISRLKRVQCACRSANTNPKRKRVNGRGKKAVSPVFKKLSCGHFSFSSAKRKVGGSLSTTADRRAVDDFLWKLVNHPGDNTRPDGPVSFADRKSRAFFASHWPHQAH